MCDLSNFVLPIKVNGTIEMNALADTGTWGAVLCIDDGVIRHTYFPKPRAKAYLDNFTQEEEDDWLSCFKVGRDKDGNLKYGPVAPSFLDIKDDMERALAMEAYFNPFKKIVLFKKLIDFLEPEYSLSIGDEHLSTILKTKSDEVIKSSVENLVPIPSASDITFDNESECDVPVCDDFTTFSNPLFDCNNDFSSSYDKSLSNEDVLMIYSISLFDNEVIISTKIDLHYFNAESNLLRSLLNRYTLIDSSTKFDYFLEEFSGELAHINPILPGIEEADFDLDEEICLVENLLYDNSSPRPINDPLSFPKNESSNFDHHDDPSFPRPPPKPPDVEIFFDFKPDKGVLIAKMVEDISEDCILMIAPDLEASRTLGFVHRPLELQSFAYGNPIS
nr:hypothetical protein [Tanacetum cinerariifolium]